MNTKRIENPCRPGSIAHRIVKVLMSSRKRNLALTEIAFKTKINTPKVERVVSALRNPYHNSRLAKMGLTIHRSIDGGFFVTLGKPNPHARRPLPKQDSAKMEAVSQ